MPKNTGDVVRAINFNQQIIQIVQIRKIILQSVKSVSSVDILPHLLPFQGK
jgi:hypothetical protein